MKKSSCLVGLIRFYVSANENCSISWIGFPNNSNSFKGDSPRKKEANSLREDIGILKETIEKVMDMAFVAGYLVIRKENRLESLEKEINSSKKGKQWILFKIELKLNQ